MTLGFRTPAPAHPVATPVKPHSHFKLMLLGLGALALLLFVRNPHLIFHDQFWYEDISVFFLEQRTEGFAAVLKTYAGYWLLFPRVVSAAATLLPIELTPIIYALGAFVAWLSVGWLVITSPLFANRRWALFAVLAWVAVPHGGEVFLNLTNAQWAMAAGLALILAEDPLSIGQGARRLFVIVAGLTGPFSSILAPVALWRLWQTKKRHNVMDWTAILALVVALVQILIVLKISSRAQSVAAVDPSRLALVLFTGVFPELFGTKTTFPADLILRLAGTVIGVMGAFWVIAPRDPGSHNRARLLLGASLFLLVGLASCMAMNGGAPLAFRQGQRYLFLPFAIYVWALIAAMSHCQPGNRVRWVAWILLATIGLYSSGNFIAPRYPVSEWAEICRSVRSGQPTEILTGPFNLRFTIPPDSSPTREVAPSKF